jgi:hypothetical protein
MDNKARMYDPQVGRFTSADTIVPGGVQGLDRYAYMNNSPVVYTDPSGHNACDGEKSYRCTIRRTEQQRQDLQKKLEEDYYWEFTGYFSLAELQIIYQAAFAIQSYVDSITGGKGLMWMQMYLGNVRFEHISGNMNKSQPESLIKDIGNVIQLVRGGFDVGIVVHELGHTWDINTAKSTTMLGATGGVEDGLNQFAGGSISSCNSILFGGVAAGVTVRYGGGVALAFWVDAAAVRAG